MHEILPLSKKELRNFGIITGSIFAVLFGLLFPWIFGYSIPNWPWIVAGVLILWALVHPNSLKPVYNGWMRIGHVLGWINTRLILSIMFYLMFLPVGLILKLLRKDPLNRKLDESTTYRVKSTQSSKDHIERPY